MRTLLIDGDVVVFRVAKKTTYEIDWGDDLWTTHGEMGEAKALLVDTIEDLQETLEADSLYFTFSDSYRWRTEVYPDYKSNRQKEKPSGYKKIRDYVMETYRSILKPTLEADDVIGILATHPTLVPGEKVIVSCDKDMLTLPGTYFNIDTRETTTTNLFEADYSFMRQTLTGDRTDGYPGCPGAGDVGAKKILSGCKDLSEMWRAVCKAYEAKGLTRDDALANARCARILRYTDWNPREQKVVYWNPPE